MKERGTFTLIIIRLAQVINIFSRYEHAPKPYK